MQDDQSIQVIAQQCASNFNLGCVIEIAPIMPSFRNQSFRVHTDQCLFLLRLHHQTKTNDDILREERVMHQARLGGVPTPELLGTFLQARRWVSAQEWVLGETLSTFALTPELAYRSGVLLANVHHALVDFVPRGIPIEHYQSIEARIAQQVASDTEKINMVYEILSQAEWISDHHAAIRYLLDLSARLQQCTESSVPIYTLHPQYLHGDFNPRNIILAKSRWMVIDWEDTFWGNPAFDIAKALLYLCGFPEHDSRQPISSSFLAGYRTYAHLSDDDLESVFWQARFVIAPDVNWLLVSLSHRDARRLSFLQRDCERLERLWALGVAGWFNSSNIHAFHKMLNDHNK